MCAKYTAAYINSAEKMFRALRVFRTVCCSGILWLNLISSPAGTLEVRSSAVHFERRLSSQVG